MLGKGGISVSQTSIFDYSGDFGTLDPAVFGAAIPITVCI